MSYSETPHRRHANHPECDGAERRHVDLRTPVTPKRQPQAPARYRRIGSASRRDPSERPAGPTCPAAGPATTIDPAQIPACATCKRPKPPGLGLTHPPPPYSAHPQRGEPTHESHGLRGIRRPGGARPTRGPRPTRARPRRDHRPHRRPRRAIRRRADAGRQIPVPPRTPVHPRAARPPARSSPSAPTSPASNPATAS
jgi:hypothetical protein